MAVHQQTQWRSITPCPLLHEFRHQHVMRRALGKVGMPAPVPHEPNWAYHPVTPGRLSDAALFSAQHGTFRYCSGLHWRLTSTEFKESTEDSRVAALDERAHNRTPVGVLAYQDGVPIG